MMNWMMTVLLLALSSVAMAQFNLNNKRTELINRANGLSAAQVWNELTSRDSKGNTVYGKCWVSTNPNACPSYFQSNVVGALGMRGWGKNPSSGDSTGCLSSYAYPGYPSNYNTGTTQAEWAKIMLLHALNTNGPIAGVSGNVNDACGLADAFSAQPGTMEYAIQQPDFKTDIVRIENNGSGGCSINDTAQGFVVNNVNKSLCVNNGRIGSN